MRIVMMGTGLFAEPTFEALLATGQVVGLFTQPDRATGSERGSTRQTGKGMKAIAEARGVPVFQPESINTAEGIEMLRSLAPDLCMVAAYGQILKPPVLGIPRHGFVNVHASLLPKYRGAAPIQWAIYHGETITGVTLFQITTGVDTGGVLIQEETPIGPDETAGDVEARLSVMGAELALRVVEQIAAGTAVPRKQDEALMTKARKTVKEDGLLDWTRSAAQVCCQVRAMQPWPSPHTFWRREGKPPLRLIVHVAHVHDSSMSGPPGTILLDPSSFRVATGEGVVEILELTPFGKKRMAAAEFLRGRRPQPGDRLGPEAP